MQASTPCTEPQFANSMAEHDRNSQVGYLCIHVGAVHVHLATVLVNDAADLVDTLLVHAVRRWVRHHQRRQAADRVRRLNQID